MESKELYQELLMEHFKHPRCRGCVDNPTARSDVRNPLCGDNIQLTVKLDEGSIKEILFTGSGCSISQASASMMAELCRGKSIHEAQDLSSTFRTMMREEIPEEAKAKLGDGAALEGVRKFSARIRCALLGWEALDRCLKGPSVETE